VRKQSELLRQTDPQAADKQILARLIEEKQAQYTALNNTLETLRRDHAALKQQLNTHQTYAQSLAYAHDVIAHVDESIQNLVVGREIEILEIGLKHFEDLRQRATTRLAQIDHTLRQQDILRASYDTEVIAQIASIEQERAELLELESALCPTSGIPHKYSVAFLNTLIDLMNYYIAMVFTYPFSINSIDIDRPLDYGKLSVTAWDRPVPDMSECSEGQAEMLDFAFMLALTKIKDIVDQPLYLDETGKSFDPRHKQQLLNLLRYITDEGDCSQLWLINHHAVVHDGLAHAQVLVLNDANIVTPPKYNEHVVMEYGTV